MARDGPIIQLHSKHVSVVREYMAFYISSMQVKHIPKFRLRWVFVENAKEITGACHDVAKVSWTIRIKKCFVPDPEVMCLKSNHVELGVLSLAGCRVCLSNLRKETHNSATKDTRKRYTLELVLSRYLWALRRSHANIPKH